jgi:cold shock CspA family protein
LAFFTKTLTFCSFFFDDYVLCVLFSRFNSLKGYGFIVPDDGSTDIFVHQSEIQSKGFRSLADGESVEFVPQNEPNGRVKATKVTGPGGSQVQGAPFRPRSDDDY